MNDLDLFGEPIPVASLGELAAAINAEHTAAERTLPKSGRRAVPPIPRPLPTADKVAAK